WPDTFVEEGNLAVNMTRLRQVLSDDNGQTYVETVPKRGYRFVAPVRELGAEHPAPAPPAPEAAVPQHPAPSTAGRYIWIATAAIVLLTIAGATFARRPARTAATGPVQSLVVTRFSSIASTKGQEHLELGIPDALSTRLASLRQLRVPPTAALRAGEDPF